MNDARKQAILDRGFECAANALASVGDQLLPHGSGVKKVRCIFHNEQTASMCVYESDGHFYCFGCQEKGSVIDIVAKVCGLQSSPYHIKLDACERFLGIQSPPNGSRPQASAKGTAEYGPEPTLDQFTARYGLTMDDFSAAGFKVVQRGPRAHVAYPVLFGDGTIGEKCKTLARRTSDGKRGQWVTPSGKEPGIIGADELDSHFGSPIVIAGGEEKMLAARKAGFSAICPQAGEHDFKPGALKLLKDSNPQTIIIAYDADEAGEKGTAALAEQLHAAGINDVRSVQWPDLADKGRDLNDVLRDEGVDALKVFLDGAQAVDMKNKVTEHFTDSPLFDATPDETEEDWAGFKKPDSLPDFPIDVLPEWIKILVERASFATNTNPAIPALYALGSLSLALAGKFKVQPWGDWSEEICLYLLTIAPPSSGKSRSVDFLRKPIDLEQVRLDKEFEETSTRAAVEIESIKARKAKLKKAVGQNDAAAKDELARLVIDEKRLKTASEPVRLISTNPTEESIAIRMQKQGDNRYHIYAVEGQIFETIMGIYTDGTPNVGIYLHGWSGDQYAPDRAGRETKSITRPIVTMTVATQPRTIKDLSRKPQLKGNGFLSRILYSINPAQNKYESTRRRSVPDYVKDEFNERMRRLLRFTPDEGLRPGQIPLLQFSAATGDLFEAFVAEMHSKFQGPAPTHSHMADWFGKAAGQAARIAALFHAADNYDNPMGAMVSPDTLNRAISLMRYFIAHAERAYDEMKFDDRGRLTEDAERLIKWWDKNNVRHATAREIHKNLRASMSKQEIFNALEELVRAKMLTAESVRGSTRYKSQ